MVGEDCIVFSFSATLALLIEDCLQVWSMPEIKSIIYGSHHNMDLNGKADGTSVITVQL